MIVGIVEGMERVSGDLLSCWRVQYVISRKAMRVDHRNGLLRTCTRNPPIFVLEGILVHVRVKVRLG